MNNLPFPPISEQLDILRRGVVEIIHEDELKVRLDKSRADNKPLKVKLGCDPSRPDLHLGHAVVLRKLRQFQDLGHEAILIVGDFTGMIGDPSGKSKTRPSLTLEETRRNGESYFQQASKILIREKTRIVYNSEWLAKMNFEEVIRLTSKYTVARMLERDDFEARYFAGEAISIHEFLYPLAQAMDSVAIEADIELGGTDQKFNLLVGRDIQREYGQQPQIIITLPILEGTDGKEKMSKSLNNYISLNDPPNEMYGKILSIPDSRVAKYFELLTDRTYHTLKSFLSKHNYTSVNFPSQENFKQYMNNLKDSVLKLSSLDRHLLCDRFNEKGNAMPNSYPSMVEQEIIGWDDWKNPRDDKRELARTIVAMYHSQQAAIEAERSFDRIFIDKQAPEKMDEYELSINQQIMIIDLMTDAKLVSSKGEARRLMQQGGVTINGTKYSDPFSSFPPESECVLKVGKRKFLKVVRK